VKNHLRLGRTEEESRGVGTLREVAREVNMGGGVKGRKKKGGKRNLGGKGLKRDSRIPGGEV